MSKARNLSKVIVNSSGVVDKASLDTTLSITGTAANVTGTVAIANGGTGATTAANARTALGVTATGADTTYAYRANNLSDLASASTARTNLGLGTAATTAATDYATAAQGTKADSALQPAAIGSTVQGYDADLQAIGALTGTSGLLKKTAANTWSLDTSTYLTSYTETDPIYTASSWYGTTNNSSNWNTAYGWGNHASAGYLTTSSAASTYLAKSNNLSDLANTTTARTNLGLGSAALASTTDFDPAGTAVALSIALG